MFAIHHLKLVAFIILMSLPHLSQAKDTPETAVAYGQNTAAGHFANINGIKLYYETYGQGEPLFLIHGNGDSIKGLKAQIDFFSKNYKVIVADSRGHGKSGLGADHLTYEQMMEDWVQLMTHLEIKKADIFGWSDGGILGLLMAIKYPEKINKLALMGANLRPDETAIYSWVRPILDGAKTQIDAMISQKDTSQDWDKQRQLLALLMTQPNISLEDLSTIKLPVLVMAGDRDVIKAEHSLEIFQNLENSHLAILPGNTHFAPMVNPEKFNGLLSDFFATPFTKPTTQDIMKENH